MAVAREGTFAAAGDRIGLTQAAVSAQMQRLEAELGFPLFDRTARSARLNARGQQVLEQAQELMRLYASLGSHNSAAAASTLVSVGAISSAQRSPLPEALAKFHRASARHRTRLVPGMSMQLVDQVDAGELDMAVIIRPPFALQRDLHWTTLAHEPFRVLVPRAVRGGDWTKLLKEHPFVRYDRASFGGRQVDRFLRTAHIEVRDACEVDEPEAIVRLVANGVGVALAPQPASVERWPATVRPISLGEHTFHRDIGLVHRAPYQLGEAARQLAALICSAYGQGSAHSPAVSNIKRRSRV